MSSLKIFVLSICLLFSACSLAARNPISTVPEDSEDQFSNRYYFLIDGKTEKAFKKLKTTEERRAFIDNFWKVRDPKKTTPENENKIFYDRNIEYVRNETLRFEPKLHGFRFDNNGGYRGDAARVFLLLGYPSYWETMTNGHFVTDLMLWIYGNENNKILYKFLFYNRSGMGHFILFRNYYGTLENRLVELSRSLMISLDDVESMYREIQMKDPQGLFLWAIYEFSPLGIHPDQALQSPMTAEAIYRSSGSRILGLPPELAFDKKFRFSSNLSLIPGELKIFEVSGKTRFYVLAPYANFDWEIFENKSESLLKMDISLVNLETGGKFFFSSSVALSIFTEELTTNWERNGLVPLPNVRSGNKTYPHEILSFDELSPGKYWAGLRLRNMFTHKNNYWEKGFTIK